ncbi:hypothetical protein LMG22037_05499 [Paraburkholderia phenoliruptrix]|uniref:Uncharacterized protein n=1 Tax=Paraburkholderia phenoliruptrix TaxID=252970 RepID=A0A6J5CCF2_9BURK|nr:hypothetical protein [Paraburkholderia phenoliruptrix]CAB3730038.1 hypothetical protein LMG22037_05499 [Paraburkholderia phenoliruptrix]
MTVTTSSDTRLEKISRTVVLKGIRDIMFDRYAGDNKTKLEWHQKIYQMPGTDILALPSTNIVSFLTAHNTNSAPKRLRDKRAYKDIANACLSFTTISGHASNPNYITFVRDAAPIRVGKFGDERDELSGIYLHRAVARLDKGIPNPKERPVLPLPWSIEFTLDIYPNKEIKEQEIRNLVEEGGLAIGLGTFRGVFGKFVIDSWK